MTLMELLVALVIGSLIITLVVRGLGLSLNLYERVGRVTASLDVVYRENQWWTDSVASLIACTEPAHCLEGGPNSFSGYGLAGLLDTPGKRVFQRWVLEEEGQGSRLLLIEGPPEQNPQPLVMSRTLPAGARFSYQHPSGRWFEQWNADTANGRLPSAIRVQSPRGRTLAYAVPLQRPYGRPDYRDVLGL